ncbi:hypothetical protein ACROYT_G043799, partial [Oculina patagonica]
AGRKFIAGFVGDSIVIPFVGLQMARKGQQHRERRDSGVYLQEISVEQHIGRSTGSIPRVFSNFEKCSSVEQNAGNFRRTRSFTLPRVLKKEKDTQSLIRIVFGAKTRHKQNNQKCESSLTNNSQDNGLNQNTNCTKYISKQNSKKSEGSSARKHNFIIPKICIQTPEQVNKDLNFTHPVTMQLQQDSTQHMTQNQPDSKECLENPKQLATVPRETTTLDKNESKIAARRKRSFSWSDVYSSEALRISTAEVLKGSSSWCAFLDSAAARETDLCSTDL